jgi:hypothetical protein
LSSISFVGNGTLQANSDQYWSDIRSPWVRMIVTRVLIFQSGASSIQSLTLESNATPQVQIGATVILANCSFACENVGGNGTLVLSDLRSNFLFQVELSVLGTVVFEGTILQFGNTTFCPGSLLVSNGPLQIIATLWSSIRLNPWPSQVKQPM